MSSSPAYEKYPDHRVDVEPASTRVRVEFAGAIVAESSRAWRVLESKCAPVLYVPREDVNESLLVKTDHSTFCPFKGHASYYTIRVGDRVAENAIWSYEEPYDEVDSLKGCAAFYGDRVDAVIEEALAT